MFEKIKSVEWLGDTLIHAKVGNSRPPVLLLHGFPQTCAMWARVAPEVLLWSEISSS